MPETTLSGVRVAILATNGFEEAELVQPKQALIDAGADVKIISASLGGDLRNAPS